MRGVAMATVALWFPLLAQENVYGDLTSFEFWRLSLLLLLVRGSSRRGLEVGKSTE